MNKASLGQGKEEDWGTSIKGYSVYAVPTGFYHFNKGSNGWSQKIGVGVGIGYVNMSGNFKRTEMSQSEEIDVKGFAQTVGVFFEFLNGNHSFVLQNYGPSISDNKYEYTQSNVDIMYRYSFQL